MSLARRNSRPRRRAPRQTFGHSRRAGGRLASFLVVLSLIFGFYLLGEAFERPLAAQAAAFSITLALIQLYFLIKPRHGLRQRATRFRRAE
jgi:hypothetical protein